jgi:pectinesterase
MMLHPPIVVLVAFLVVATAGFSRAEPAATRPAPKVRIVLAGDSTVTDKAGWGVGFAALLADDVELLNHARGGRSSRTFRQEGSWEKVLATKADYVLIQFGHNDEPGKDRSTDRETEFPKYMRSYVDEARAAGMTPILVTPLVRRQFKDGKIESSLARHAEIVREIAKDMNVPLVDLHDRSLVVCNALGKDACVALLSTEKPTGGYDGTHLTPAGSMLMGAIVADELHKAVPDLAPHIRAVPASSAAPATQPVPAGAARPTTTP